MELELGLKITRTRDDITSTSDLRISRHPFGPVFMYTETDQMFILIAHLKGNGPPLLSFFIFLQMLVYLGDV